MSGKIELKVRLGKSKDPRYDKYPEEIIEDFEEIGYNVQTELVNGLDIGMKQQRKRVFFIGNIRN